jgi:hypothetical protein
MGGITPIGVNVDELFVKAVRKSLHDAAISSFPPDEAMRDKYRRE